MSTGSRRSEPSGLESDRACSGLLRSGGSRAGWKKVVIGVEERGAGAGRGWGRMVDEEERADCGDEVSVVASVRRAEERTTRRTEVDERVAEVEARQRGRDDISSPQITKERASGESSSSGEGIGRRSQTSTAARESGGVVGQSEKDKRRDVSQGTKERETRLIRMLS